MTKPISNTDDVIDSRDIIERIDELTAERNALAEIAKEAAGETERTKAQEELQSWDEDYGADLKALESLTEEASDAPDWAYGTTLIRDDYFAAYAKELAEDTGEIKKDATWPHNCIDWEQAAEELRVDYTAVEFGGETYWVRS